MREETFIRRQYTQKRWNNNTALDQRTINESPDEFSINRVPESKIDECHTKRQRIQDTNHKSTTRELSQSEKGSFCGLFVFYYLN